MTESREHADAATFAEAMEASLNFDPIEQGSVLAGTIVSISGDDAFVSYGGPSEAVIAAGELEGLNIGDVVEGVVVESGAQVRISRKMLAGRASLERIRQAWASSIPVEGKVTARNKGGFDVTVGGMRAFCPLSQIDLGKIADAEAYVGQTFEFRIIELSDDGRKFVVSRSAILKEEAAARAVEARKTIVPGAVLSGTVRSIMPFGAFVDLGGVDGLVHVSELSRRRINDPKEIVQLGQEVTVTVIRVEDDGKRISLSMKDQEPDPWETIADRYPVGSEFSGRVARGADFGIFVELEPGIDGLVHVSQLPLGVKQDDESIAVGAHVQGWVRDVDTKKKRVSLAMREVATSDPWDDAEVNYPAGKLVEGVVERAGQPGVFVRLEPGLTGLIPVSELGLPPGSDPAKAHQPGGKVIVKVLTIDSKRKRIALSTEAAKGAADRNEYLSYVQEAKQQAVAAEGKSALALALEKALQKR
ncbi:MAG TPA: S1 RNA-binding domain-containing protein [Thermoanaerobaculia bacterium]|nr:S1 RNA-binding domain-containing protein [Thermoanaerobaculia bacterium]